MFVTGLPFLTSLFKPLIILLTELIKSRKVEDVKLVIERQKAAMA
jgi:hypothetical protein